MPNTHEQITLTIKKVNTLDNKEELLFYVRLDRVALTNIANGKRPAELGTRISKKRFELLRILGFIQSLDYDSPYDYRAYWYLPRTAFNKYLSKLKR